MSEPGETLSIQQFHDLLRRMGVSVFDLPEATSAARRLAFGGAPDAQVEL